MTPVWMCYHFPYRPRIGVLDVDKNLAEQLLEKLNGLNAPFNDAVELSEQIADVNERSRFRKRLGELMGYAYTDLIMPIHEQFPELDPFKKREGGQH